jgi:hypothetical protein
LGLAVAARPHYIFGSIFLFLLWLNFLKERYNFRLRKARGEFFSLFTPFLFCIGLLGLYNYARFDSWIEFGQRYQLAGINLPKTKIFALDRIFVDFFFYFLAPCRINLDFPFFHLAPSYPWTLPQNLVGIEPGAGVLANVAFLNILFLFPLSFHLRIPLSTPPKFKGADAIPKFNNGGFHFSDVSHAMSYKCSQCYYALRG